jgi:hypothetical protein
MTRLFGAFVESINVGFGQKRFCSFALLQKDVKPDLRFGSFTVSPAYGSVLLRQCADPHWQVGGIVHAHIPAKRNAARAVSIQTGAV